MIVTEQPDRKLTYDEAAAEYGVSTETVRGWARARLINKYTRPLDKKVYVSTAEIDALRSAEPRKKDEGGRN